MYKISLTVHRSIRILNRVNSVLALCCGGLVFLYMFLVSANIIGRYVFNHPVNGTLEIGQMLLACVVFFSLGFAEMGDAHIRVTVILKSLPQKWQARMEIAIFATAFAMMVLMAWKALPYALESYEINEVNMSVDVPVWPTKFVFFMGWSLLGFQFFLEFLRRLLPNPDSNKALSEEDTV